MENGKQILEGNTNTDTGSWIIVSKETGKPVFETWSRSVAAHINLKKYEVLTCLQWLQRFNASIGAN